MSMMNLQFTLDKIKTENVNKIGSNRTKQIQLDKAIDNNHYWYSYNNLGQAG